MTVKSLGLLLLLVCAGLYFAQRGARDPAGASGPPAAPAGCQVSVPYAAGAGGYATYRIPAVVRTRA
ncbi:hypothetical protein ACFWWN_31890, partial [Streptomyces sp. NPDC059082]